MVNEPRIALLLQAVGWGKTIKGVPSKILQEVSMPYVPYNDCASAVPDDFRGYITSDKFCAGRLNGESIIRIYLSLISEFFNFIGSLKGFFSKVLYFLL